LTLVVVEGHRRWHRFCRSPGTLIPSAVIPKNCARPPTLIPQHEMGTPLHEPEERTYFPSPVVELQDWIGSIHPEPCSAEAAFRYRQLPGARTPSRELDAGAFLFAVEGQDDWLSVAVTFLSKCIEARTRSR